MTDQAEVQSPQEMFMTLLGAEETQTEEAQDQVEPEQEPEEQESEEVETEESEEAEPEEPQYLKLNVKGEELEKPLDEVIALAQKGVDYTQKTQEVADQRRALEDYAQTLNVQEREFQEKVELNNAMMGDIANLQSVNNQLAQFAQVNWQQLSDNDFVEAQKLFFTYIQLQQQRTTLANELAQKRVELQQRQAQSIQERVAQGKEILAKEIPNWSRETSQAIISAGKDYGFSESELGIIYDPRQVKVLHDAMQWRNSQKNTIVKNKISQAKPVVKAGAKENKNLSNEQVKRDKLQLKKTGKVTDAARIFEQFL